MDHDACPTESNHQPMKALLQNTQRIKVDLSFRPHEKNIITTLCRANKTTVSKGMKTSPSERTKVIKSSYKYFVTFDRDTKKV